jgi:hypothetical protein
MTDRFDWNEDESVVLPQQLAVAVYRGEQGDLVIRQKGQLGIPDSCICIRPSYAVNLCAAILREVGLHAVRIVEIPLTENELIGIDGNLMHMPKAGGDRFDHDTGKLLDGGNGNDSTAAERKRRQRARARDAAAGIVTGRDGDRDTVTKDRDPLTGVPSPNPLLRLAHR